MDAAAFQKLYRDTFDAVYRYAYVLTGDSTLAEDIAAETYLRAWQHRTTLRDPNRVLSWLLSIAHNYARTAQQRNGRVHLVDSDVLNQWATPEVGPEAAALAQDLNATLRRVVGMLTPLQQQVIFLRYFQDASTEQIACALGRRRDAIRALQHRAVRQLHAILAG